MKPSPLRRSTPLRRERPPAQRTPPGHKTPLRTAPRYDRGLAIRHARKAMAASEAQRAKIVGGACVVCLQTKGLTPAHLAPRTLGGCDHPDCVVPLCWRHHRAYDTGRLDLLVHLEPRWRAEVAHAVIHLGLIGAVRQLGGRRAA
jgi:hypothetical protein